MNKTELIDVIDEQGNVVDTLSRAEVDEGDYISQIVLAFVFNPHGGVWIQLRPASKAYFPSCWDVSACGQVMSGETKEAAIEREVLEETGLSPKMQFVETFMSKFTVNGKGQKRLAHLFITTTEDTPQADGIEAEAFKCVDVKRLREDALSNPGKFVPTFVPELDKALAAYNA